MKFIANFLFIFILLISNLKSYGIKIKLYVNKTIMQPTAEIIELNIEIYRKKTEKLLISKSDIKLIPKKLYQKILKINSKKKKINVEHLSYKHLIKKYYKKNIIKEIFSYVFQIFEIHNLLLKPIKLTIQNNSKIEKPQYVFYTPEILIESISPKFNKSNKIFKDIYEIQYKKKNNINYTSIIFIFLIIFFILYFLFKRIQHYYLIKNDSLKTPYKQAYFELEKLEKKVKKNLKTINDKKQIYVFINHILKHFIERKYQLSSLELTLEESILLFKKHLLNYPWINYLINRMELYDKIKFKNLFYDKTKIIKDIKEIKDLLNKIDKNLRHIPYGI